MTVQEHRTPKRLTRQTETSDDDVEDVIHLMNDKRVSADHTEACMLMSAANNLSRTDADTKRHS